MVAASIKYLVSKFASVRKWSRSNRTELALLLFLISFALFLRLFRISEYMTFLGDEGRDVIVVRRLLLEKDLIFVGPGTSVGNMYLGPFYYYLMAPALLLANFSPVGPAVQIALLDLICVFLIWLITREWFGKTASIISSFLYAISPVVIYHARFSWNPNIMPFFALLTIYSVWKFWSEKNYVWIAFAGLFFSVVMQSHYMGLLLLPVVGLFWVLALINAKRNKHLPEFAKYSIYALVIWIISITPLLIFDSKYDWRNIKSIGTFFARNDGVSSDPTQIINNVLHVTQLIFTRLLSAKNELLGKVALVIISLSSIWVLGKVRLSKSKPGKATFLLLVWMFVSLIGISSYRYDIYDHYYGFLFPAPFILLGGLNKLVTDKHKLVGTVIYSLLIFTLIFVSFLNSPIRQEPNKQLTRTQNIVKKIAEESGGESFNFALIADSNYEGAYEYFMYHWQLPLIKIDPQRANETIMDQVFVVCEYEDKSKCQPASNPKAEIANFGWSKILESWDVDGLALFRLGHNYSGK